MNASPLRIILAHEPSGSPLGATIAAPPPHLEPLGGNSHSVTETPLRLSPPVAKSLLDEAMVSANHSQPLVIAVAARWYAWFSQWASSRGIPQEVILNTGATDPAHDVIHPRDVVRSALRHCRILPAVVTLFPIEVTHALSGRRLVCADRAQLDTDDMEQALLDMCRSPIAEGGAEPLHPLGRGAAVATSFARVGLMGNPSDQLHGKALAVTIDNFRATVRVEPSETGAVHLMPHPVADALTFGSIADIADTAARNGYGGGIRIVIAACKRFYSLMRAEGRLAEADMAARPFCLSYDTNVPRQVGLAGSSCIISAVFKALAIFYGVELDPHTTPNAILAAEWEELGIHAGLMDRVVQLWGGLVLMDFARDVVAELGFGRYSSMDIALLPPLFLAYAKDPSDSGKIHSNVKERFARNDPQVIAASATWRGYVDEAVDALQSGHHERFAELVDKNFNLRRELYGDACLGRKNLHMVEIARRHEAAAKFPGSGGAVLVVPKNEATIDAMRAELEENDYVLIKLRPCAP